MHRSLIHESFYWDTLIALVMMAGLGSAVGAWYWITVHSSSAPFIVQIVVGLFGILGFVGFLLVVWGSIVEPRLIKVNKKSIHIKNLPEMKIAVIGDFHVGPYKSSGYLKRVVDRVNALEPDIILLPGDFIFNHRSSTYGLEPLKHLHAPLGVFAVLGNHDTGHMLEHTHGAFIPNQMPDRSADVIRVLERLAITVLRNTHIMLRLDGKPFAIAGTDHSWMKTADTAKAFNGIPKDVPVLLLTHIPDAVMEEETKRASLIICGHTHGGQIRLPLIGNLYPIPDRLGNAFDQGVFTLENGTILAITHGIGETMARARLFCPPEIMVLNIQV